MKIAIPGSLYNKRTLYVFFLFQWFSLNVDADVYKIPESVNFKDEELDLLGDGIRREFLLDVYQIGFYSEVKNVNKLVKTAVEFPLAIRIKILTNILPDEPPSFWIKLFGKVLDEEQFKLFTNHYSRLEEGDILAINFRPETGSSIRMKGKLLLNINDAGFIKTVIEGFIGAEPVSNALKDSILNPEETSLL